MEANITREQALALLREYNKEPFHLQHALTVEGVLRWYARELGYGADETFWALAGLLHDITKALDGPLQLTSTLSAGRRSTAARPQSCWKRAAAPRSSSTPSAPTGTAFAATWSPSTRWRRCSSRRMS